jgi:hypothetical protein
MAYNVPASTTFARIAHMGVDALFAAAFFFFKLQSLFVAESNSYLPQQKLLSIF